LRNIAHLPGEIWLNLPLLLDVLADRHEARPALRSAEATLSYRELARRKNRFARWGRAQAIAKGDMVCLLMPNCADYLAIWLGLSQIGAVVALMNTNLTGELLRRAIAGTRPTHIITDRTLLPGLEAIGGELPRGASLWVAGAAPGCLRGLDITPYADTPLGGAEYTPIHARDTALLIFTSGTTGMPKAARISHYRVLEWSYWFAGIMGIEPSDCLYDCLPLYHSTGGVAGMGGVLVQGGTVVLRPRFSIRSFWPDIVQNGCTMFLYIGELCRYLVTAAPHELEAQHRLRLCCGNGLQADVWRRFVQRFRVPEILEFYASTEGNVSLYNCEGQPGAIGRVPAFLAHRFPVALIRCDPESGTVHRNAEGFCIRCDPDEAGEAIGRIPAGSAASPGAFDGYTDGSATAAKILRHVFVKGDAWFRTGDLMRQDRAGFYYFVDRMGDSFRWKGENVSTSQIAEVLGAAPGVTGAVVYGVAVPGAEGRAGMAAVTTGPGFTLDGLYAYLEAALPHYARPRFLRLCAALETTGTFKPVKAVLVREGYDAALTRDPLYIEDQAIRSYRRLGDAPGVAGC
jgi:fatty-acyl-CoA synthase